MRWHIHTHFLLKNSAPELLARTLSNIADLSPEEIQARKQASLKMIREEFTWEKLIQGLISGIKEKTDRSVAGSIL